MTQESGQTVDVLVIGAGMAGLTAAAELQRAGCLVLVLDKGRGLGGRLASRRIGGAAFAVPCSKRRELPPVNPNRRVSETGGRPRSRILPDEIVV